MKYISFTFDDGRRDNFIYAYPVMKKYGLTGTLFCTTGYIDGTWQKADSWRSAGEAIHIDELKRLQEDGWELALHGDKHTTDVEDLKRASEKMALWGFSKRPIGFSIPYSNTTEEKLNEVIDRYWGTELLYIRAGMRINKKSLRAKALFALYTYGRLQWAYNRFNQENLTDFNHIDRKQIYSVVVRCKDDPGMVTKFLEQIPENTCAVLMFHSILPESSEYYGADSWNWSLVKFEKFCSVIHEYVEKGKCKVATVRNILAEAKCMDANVQTITEYANHELAGPYRVKLDGTQANGQ